LLLQTTQIAWNVDSENEFESWTCRWKDHEYDHGNNTNKMDELARGTKY
jgi:hypothetical protein